jgi:hypothetical protein
MFEHRTDSLISREHFLRRMALAATIGLLCLGAALGIGMAGYHYFEGLSWIDSFANASMILSGMGPLTQLQTDNEKIFAGSYALFSGLTFITVVGVVLAPLIHRVFHRFHLGLENEKSGESGDQ